MGAFHTTFDYGNLQLGYNEAGSAQQCTSSQWVSLVAGRKWRGWEETVKNAPFKIDMLYFIICPALLVLRASLLL
jgi:hypothetical protein